MSRFIRFLSRRRTGRGIRRTALDQVDSAAVGKKGYLLCKVELLDGTDITIDLPVRKRLMLFMIDSSISFQFAVSVYYSVAVLRLSWGGGGAQALKFCPAPNFFFFLFL